MASEMTVRRSGVDRAEQMLDANGEFVAFVATCSDEEWGRICPGEGWPVATVAHHIAWGHEVVAGWIRTIRSGADVPGSPETHDQSNQAKAAEVAGISRDEVIRLANRNVAQLAELLRSLSLEDLSRSASFGPAGGAEMSIDQMAGSRRHLDRHLGNIRSALGR